MLTLQAEPEPCQAETVPTRLTVFLNDSFVARLDAWRRAQANPPTRGMALRLLAGIALDVAERPPPEEDKGGRDDEQ